VPSFLSEPGPLIRAWPARARIELGRAGLGPGPNNGLRAGLTGLVLIGHLWEFGTAKLFFCRVSFYAECFALGKRGLCRES
jgi:hypothetical protein